MATISATQPIRTITPPSSSHGEGAGSWDYAVPLDDENTARLDEKTYTNSSKPTAFSSRQPLSNSSSNGGIAKMPSPQPDLKPAFSEEDYLAIAPGRALSRKKSDIAQPNDPDSVYKTGNKSQSNGLHQGGKRKAGSNGHRKSPEDDEENWIHRDKLAAIESRELEAAGFPVGRVSRSGSRATSSLNRPTSQNRAEKDSLDAHREDIEDEEEEDPYAKYENAYPPNHKPAGKRQRVVSPTSASAEEDDDEVRTHDEVLAAKSGDGQYVQLPQRLNGSRLPMPRASPVPVPTKIVERDSPLTRSRNSSAQGLPEILRPRSRSLGSQTMLDDEPPQTPTNGTYQLSSSSDSQPSHSPPKARIPKGAPISGARKGSTTVRQVSTSKPANRIPSGTSPQKRPGTSSARPSTGHRPEGDPPWMASMYKPDPRLPPDQQILPTHAKRLAQEQWEKDGKIGTIYDRDFRLLNTEEISSPPPELQRDEERRGSEVKTTVLNTWPLHTPPLGSPRSQTSTNRPGTSGTDHGGYKMMPTIHNTPPVNTPLVTPKPIEPIRVQDTPEENIKEKKGCMACCVVM